ncbi:MAG TPA: hypothetical protein VFF73_35630 [Planctomycetota bacterium]|nr:hypothetical protein [Planctomycetota bacterium]
MMITRKLAAVLVAALAGASFAGLPGAQAQGDAPTVFESAPGLYTAAELGLGGRPLYGKLFPNAWPTTKDFRRMTLEHGDGAFADSVGAFLSSGLGVPLDVSLYERWKQNQQGKPVARVMADRWNEFRQAAGLQAQVNAFNPTFLPYRRGDPGIASFDEAAPWATAWSTKGQDKAITLDAIGLEIYAFALFADQQLSIERQAQVSGSTQTCVGRTDVDGFFALVGLECAMAAVRELQGALCLDARADKGKVGLTAMPKNYKVRQSQFQGRETFFPHGFDVEVGKGTATYTLPANANDQKSRLFDQAALILGLSQLAKAGTSPKGVGKIFNAQRGLSFEPNALSDIFELLVFVVESTKEVNWNPQNNGRIASFADVNAPGTSLLVEDAGLLLVALEQFLSIDPKKAPQAIQADLGEAQGHMATILHRVTMFLEDAQKTSNPPQGGLCDMYNLDGSPALSKNGVEQRSLLAQGLAVRGLLAAARASSLPAYAGAKTVAAHPEAKDAAMLILKWLENRWDKSKRAYVDAPGSGPSKLRAQDAAAILGAFRDAAFDTVDARYLQRYRTYLTTLRARGLVLSESQRSRDVLGDGGDLKGPGTVLKAPVVASEVTIP